MKLNPTRLLGLAFVFGIGISNLQAQIPYVLQKTTTLSGAAEVITLQQPSSGSRFVKLISAYVDCSVACTVTLERNGATANSTTLTPLNNNPNESSSVATGWSSSNVGTGTVLQVSAIPASSFQVFDLSTINLIPNNNTTNNFTIRTSSITGTVHITLKYTEQ